MKNRGVLEVFHPDHFLQRMQGVPDSKARKGQRSLPEINLFGTPKGVFCRKRIVPGNFNPDRHSTFVLTHRRFLTAKAVKGPPGLKMKKNAKISSLAQTETIKPKFNFNCQILALLSSFVKSNSPVFIQLKTANRCPPPLFLLLPKRLPEPLFLGFLLFAYRLTSWRRWN